MGGRASSIGNRGSHLLYAALAGTFSPRNATANVRAGRVITDHNIWPLEHLKARNSSKLCRVRSHGATLTANTQRPIPNASGEVVFDDENNNNNNNSYNSNSNNHS
ncbi:unnamed protein product, partial [Ectocarpus sp. 13 AM-2016]